MSQIKTVLITGANGSIGKKLRRHFPLLNYDIRLIDRNSDAAENDKEVLIADMSSYDATWVDRFTGVDTVIHLAANPWQAAPWNTIWPNNVVATQNVVNAARRNGVRRMIFASSNWVMAGYRFEEVPYTLTSQMPAKPINPYGISKLMGEQVGLAVADDLSFIAFRIGASMTDFDKLSGCAPWFQEMWLSDRDLCQAMERAVETQNIQYAILNLMSDNKTKSGESMRWDIQETRKAIGYIPQDGARTNETEEAIRNNEKDRGYYRELARLTHECSLI